MWAIGVGVADQRPSSQYKGGIFKVPELFRWHILVTGRVLVDELRKANESDLSMMEAVNDVSVAPSRPMQSKPNSIFRSCMAISL